MTPALKVKIEKQVARLRLAVRKFVPDPLLDPQLSLIVSTADSAKKRHGNIIELAMADALSAAGNRYKLLNAKDIRVPVEADMFASLQSNQADSFSGRIKYTGAGRKLRIDLVVLDTFLHTLSAYEVKRGLGYSDAGKQRSIMSDLRATASILPGYAKNLQVHTFNAHIIFYYGNRCIPKPWSLIGGELDDHFQIAMIRTVEEATDLYKNLLNQILHKESEIWDHNLLSTTPCEPQLQFAYELMKQP